MHANTRVHDLMPRTEHTRDPTRIRREMADADGRVIENERRRRSDGRAIGNERRRRSDGTDENEKRRRSDGRAIGNERRRRSDGTDENDKRCRSTTSADRRTEPKHAYAALHANTQRVRANKMASPDASMRHELTSPVRITSSLRTNSLESLSRETASIWGSWTSCLLGEAIAISEVCPFGISRESTKGATAIEEAGHPNTTSATTSRAKRQSTGAVFGEAVVSPSIGSCNPARRVTVCPSTDVCCAGYTRKVTAVVRDARKTPIIAFSASCFPESSGYPAVLIPIAPVRLLRANTGTTLAVSTGFFHLGPVLAGYWNDNSKSVLAASIMPVLTQYQLPLSSQ
ncbi:unnamed protein product [Trichogramma brassicae]|uniref:Uncharacterized protein n=1 Tax=Trichogramma brassicae TaxID=86971 RepID=A0A6H5I840_9HYME|nr:unnamed protein product [Trichogramma brassicae]